MGFGHKKYINFFSRIRMKRCVVFAKEWGVYEDGVVFSEAGKDCSAVCVVLVVGHSFPIVVTPPNHLCSPEEGAGPFFSRCSSLS